jgi:MFS superfamily sulfate permease-like transporter
MMRTDLPLHHFCDRKEKTMSEADRIKYLRIALIVVGLIFIFGIWPLTIVWPSGWSWHAEGRSYYLEMILAIYATLGVFLILAARNPLAHRSLILFAVWSSVVHGGVMAVQSFNGDHNMGHLWGDVSALFAVAAVLALLTGREAKAEVR